MPYALCPHTAAKRPTSGLIVPEFNDLLNPVVSRSKYTARGLLSRTHRRGATSCELLIFHVTHCERYFDVDRMTTPYFIFYILVTSRVLAGPV